MSLDQFFAKKDKKKPKIKVTSQQFLEQLSDGQSRQEPEKKLDQLTTNAAEDAGDWEPILDEELELDLENMRIGDLATVKSEQNKEKKPLDEKGNKEDENADSKVIWGGRPVEEEEEESEPEAPASETVPSKPSAYVLPHLRANPPSFSNQKKPNLESADEFPTLDAAAAPPKKVVLSPAKIVVDGSWQEAGKSKSNRNNDTPGVYKPPSMRSFDSSFTNFSGGKDSYGQRLSRRCEADGQLDVDGGSDTIGWSRGELLRGSGPSGRSGADLDKLEFKRGDLMSTKKTFDLPLSNRFAALDDTV